MPNYQTLERAHVRSNFSVSGSFSMRFNGTVALVSGENNNATLTLNQSFVSLTTSGGTNLSITGFTAGRDGQRIVLFNGTATDVLLKVNSASSLAANRIYTPNFVDIIFYPFATKELIYNAALAKWFLIGSDESLSTSQYSVISLANSANNNIAISENASFIAFDTGGASATITGFTAGRVGQRVILSNLTSYSIPIFYDSGSSSAGNRIINPAAATIYIKSGSTKEIIYSGTYWLLIGNDDTLVTEATTAFSGLSAGNNNNLAVSNYENFITLSGSPTVTITGFAAGRSGQRLIVKNLDDQAMILAYNSSSSSTGNKISNPNRVDFVIAQRGAIELVYNGGVWNIIGVSEIPFSLITPVEPNSITLASGNNNNKSIPDGANFVVVGISGVPATLTGMTAGVNGQRLILANGTGDVFAITHADTNSSVGNRILTWDGATVYVHALSTVEFIYENVHSAGVWWMLTTLPIV